MSHIRSHLSEVSNVINLKSESCISVVVDGNAFAYWVYFKSIRSWTCDYINVRKFLMVLLDKFTASGVRLVFVNDGPTEASKLRSKVSRLHDHTIACSKYPQFTSDAVSPPVLIIECIKSILVHHSTANESAPLQHIIIFSSGEADRDIVAVARDIDAVGILSNDSDMLVYDSGYDIGFLPLWSLSSDDTCYSVHVVLHSLYAKCLGISRQVREMKFLLVI